jgi:glycosyltransferase involved in cell wall biosynthesis
MNKKVIWCISKYASPETYGPSTKLFNTARYLSNFHDVTLISSNSNHHAKYPQSNKKINVEFIESLRHIWINQNSFKKTRSLSRLISWFSFDYNLSKLQKKINEVPDLILVSSLPLFTILWALKIKRKYDIKVIFEVRDIYPLTMMEMGYSRWNPIVLYMSYVERKAYKYSDLVVGTMSGIGQRVEEVLGYKKETFHSPIGLSPLFKQSVEELQEKRFIQNKFVVGYVGSVGKANNLDTLIQGAQHFQSDDRFHFLVVGDGEMLNAYKNIASSNVTFTGRVAPENVKYWINQCDVLYLSTLKSKVFEYGQSMNKLREYLGSGKPLILAYEGYIDPFLKEAGILYVNLNDSNVLITSIKKINNLSKQDLIKISDTNKAISSRYYDYKIINESYKEVITKTLNNRVSL